jgi:hypothetical protein
MTDDERPGDAADLDLEDEEFPEPTDDAVAISGAVESAAHDIADAVRRVESAVDKLHDLTSVGMGRIIAVLLLVPLAQLPSVILALDHLLR